MPRIAFICYSVAILCIAAALAAAATRLTDWQGLLIIGVAFGAICTAGGMMIAHRDRKSPMVEESAPVAEVAPVS